MQSYSTINIKHQRNIILMMTLSIALVLFLVAGVTYVGNKSGLRVQAATLFNRNFEDGNVTGSGWSAQRVSTDRARVVIQTDNGKPAPQGSKLLRFDLQQGDNPLAQWCCQTTNRVEILASTDENKGQDRWYSWYQMFDTSYPSYDTYPTSQNQGWQIFAQWHGDDSLSPPLAWWAAKDNIVLASGNGNSYIEQWRGPMNRGQWNLIKMHVIWGDSGSITLWFNGTKVLQKTGIDNVTNPPLYFKTGMYRPSSLSQKSITYMDDFRMGTAEADVAGAVTPAPSPAPTPAPAPAPSPSPSPSPQPTPAPEPTQPPTTVEETPPVEIPGANPDTPVAIPRDITVTEDGSLVADFNGDGVNELAKDSNNDGSINPKTEITFDTSAGNTNSFYTSSKPDNASPNEGVITVKPGPLPEVKIAKPIAYTFLVAQGVAITGAGVYLAIMKLTMFAAIRARWGL